MTGTGTQTRRVIISDEAVLIMRKIVYKLTNVFMYITEASFEGKAT